MRKTIGTFLYYFSISFISSFFPKHFMQALKQFHFCMGLHHTNESLGGTPGAARGPRVRLTQDL